MNPLSRSTSPRRQGRKRPSRKRQGTVLKSKPVVCWQCRAVLARGRWSHGAKLEVPADICLPPVLCDACERVGRREPLHVIRIEGMPAASVREVSALARRVQAAEAAAHPQERLVPVVRRGAAWAIGTTGHHLARRLAAAIRRTWRRRIEQVVVADSLISMRWQSADKERTAAGRGGGRGTRA